MSWFFQWTFSATAATIVSGCVAERCSFRAYLIYAIFLTSFIYPVVVHMTWSSEGVLSPWRDSDADDGSGGRLVGGCGVIDFAGSGTVHMTGGVAAAVAAAFVGPRLGRFSPGWKAPEAHPVYQTLGTFILWLGWYGFNGASTLAIVGYSGLAAHVMMTTTIAASACCLTCTILGYLFTHFIDPTLVNNGILAGLVSITSSCATSSLWGSFIIGILGAAVYYFGSKFVSNILKLDDVVDAIAVHGFCGIWGVLAAALFTTPYYYGIAYATNRKDRCAGVFYGGNIGGSLKAAFVRFFWFFSFFILSSSLGRHRYHLRLGRIHHDPRLRHHPPLQNPPRLRRSRKGRHGRLQTRRGPLLRYPLTTQD